jgi:hypothetical protein
MEFPRRYEPLAPDHPLVGKVCPRCGTTFAAGDEVTLVNPRPNNPEDAAKAAAGRAYNARMDPVHWKCR